MPNDAIYSKIREIAIQCLIDENLPVKMPVTEIESVKLLGANALCDSLGLVRYLVSLEERIHAEFGTQIHLMDERAVSQTRSPFRHLAALTDFVLNLLNAEGLNENRETGRAHHRRS